jgi:hypothetical protein
VGHSLGEQVGATIEARRGRRADLVIPGCAHWVAEETPEETLAALAAFLAPYEQELGAAALAAPLTAICRPAK